MLEQRAGEDNFKRLLSRLVITSCQPATAAGKLHIPPCLAAANAMFFDTASLSHMHPKHVRCTSPNQQPLLFLAQVARPTVMQNALHQYK